MKPIAAPILGGMITSTIHVLILVPVFFLLMKRRDLRAGRLTAIKIQHADEQVAATR
jgi:Cu(I)/Ag(I) efflux system membrane protein CusA/SilA